MATNLRARTPSVVTVGHCSACGVAFAGRSRDRELVTHVLGVHEQICPGGDRAGEVARPLEALRRDPLPFDSRRA